MRGSAKKLVRRVVDRVARPYFVELEARVSELSHSVAATREELARATQALRVITDDEPESRRRLYALRRDPSYELAFKEREPLVSFVVPTYDSYETLREVSLPSILGQSYNNLEVIVIGDGAPPETAEAIADIDDPRVTYFNRPYRGPYAGTDRERWLVAGSPPFNEGLFRARGRWIAPMGDDDAARPEHTRTLVEEAQHHGYEMCYGLKVVHFEDGRKCEIGEFPLRLGGGGGGGQASIYHAGLGFLYSQLIDAVFGEPNDWSRQRRMLRIGVYIGMVDEIVTNKHETNQTFEAYMYMRPNAAS